MGRCAGTVTPWALSVVLLCVGFLRCVHYTCLATCLFPDRTSDHGDNLFSSFVNTQLQLWSLLDCVTTTTMPVVTFVLNLGI